MAPRTKRKIPTKAKRFKEIPPERSLKKPEPRELVVLDPLQLYMSEVAKYPVLTEEEERQLAKQLRQDNDVEAARKLVLSNLRLVVKIAMEYRSTFQNVLDLIQEGNIGLMKAVAKYNPDIGVRLANYAAIWIKSYVLKFILDNFRLVKIGTTQAQRKLFYNLKREKEKIESLGYVATPDLLAERLGVKPSDVKAIEQRIVGSDLSLDRPVHEDRESGALFLDFLEDESLGAEEKLADEEVRDVLHDKLAEFSAHLGEREKVLLTKRLIADVPETLQAIADRYGITRERARQIEARLLEKLRSFLESQGFTVNDVR